MREAQPKCFNKTYCDSDIFFCVQETHVEDIHQHPKLQCQTASKCTVIWHSLIANGRARVLDDHEIALGVTVGVWSIWSTSYTNTWPRHTTNWNRAVFTGSTKIWIISWMVASYVGGVKNVHILCHIVKVHCCHRKATVEIKILTLVSNVCCHISSRPQLRKIAAYVRT